MAKDGIEVRIEYPRNDKYDYETFLEPINLDKERENDLLRDKGFIISNPSSIKKDVKDPDGIFSPRFGQTLQDMNPFADRYKCECGNLRSRINRNIICPVCKTPVKYVDDDFEYFGWIVLKDPYYLIHPNMYATLQYFIGDTKLDNIIKPVNEKDEDGFETTREKPKDEPFFGLGLLDLKDRFDEIMDFYLMKNPNKKDYYDHIMKYKDRVFIQSVPVYTTHLRPYRIENDSFFYEGTNALYNMINRLVSVINKDDLKIFRKKKPKNQLLYDAQVKYNELYIDLKDTLSGKRGSIRALNL